ERIMLLDDHRLYSGQTFSPVRDPDPDGLFAVFYTSGTTGKPKGVMVENKSVVSHIQWFAGTYGIDSTTNVLQMTNYIFDPSIQEFFGTLLHGATMHIAGQNVILDREQFGDYVDRHQIHIINLIPTLLKQLMSSKRKLNSLRIIISGGERLDDSLKDELVGNGYVLYNNYGPTETTVDALSSLCSAGKVTLGKPIANARCYILDRDRNLAPIGIAGELYIAGAGVARGYLNMPELTAEKFMNDPFMPDERMYRTGDMGRWLPDGEVELIGRADHQVKIRGHRIELGEIQNRLLQHDQIRDAVVIDLDNHESKKTICAYIVANIPLETRHLREFLSAELPDYMVPSSFVRLEKLPLTSIGKIDRRALPAPAAITGNEFAAPRSQTEEVLADIWTTVLGIDKGAVGINDNFFELGGDSILSIQIAGKAMQAGIPITVSQIFQHQTIAELANEAEQLEVRADKAAEAPETGEVPLTPIQMWFFEQNLENVHHWNQAVLLETRPGMNPEWLKQSFQNLVRAHDSFRLRFIKRGGEWIQTYSDARGEGSFQVFDMSGISPWQREEKMKGTCSLLQRSLNITEGPLIRAAYFQFGKEDSGKLFITAHHLVVDGYSWRVITQDLQDGCEQLEKGESVKLLPGSLSFKKWSAYIREYAKSDKIKGEQSYWQNSIPSSVNPIPADLDHGLNTEEAADTISVTLTKEETDSLLHDIHGPFRTRIDDILLAALSCTLRDWSGAALIDLEGHGREKLLEEHDVSRTVGWFTSVYPIVLGDTAGDAESGEMSGSLIKQVKERYRSIPGGGIGYEILYYLAEDGIRETIASKPRAQISFNYLGQFDQVLKKSGLFKLADVNTGSARALKGIRSHLIDIDAMIAGGALTIDWKYGTRIHLPETIRQLAEDFVRHLRSIILICKAEQTRQFTPSDFPLAPVEQNKLDEWAGQYRNVEDIYTLSPVQQSMIFHHVYSPGSSVTVEQTIYSIHTGLNIGAFEKVWQTVLNRHESLRASYHWEGLEEPVQIIHHDINIPFEVLDWTGVPESGRRTRMERLIEEDRRRGFDLSKPPLMRILVVQWEKSAYEVIWTHHHLQLDGWCIGILLSEIGTLYEAYSSGHKPAMKDALPFKEYIEWYRAQNLEQAEHYWKRTLKGFKTPIHFAGLFPAAAKIAAEQTPAFGKAVYEVQPAMQEALRNFSRKHRLTLNTIIQGAWAILLNRYSGEKDIVFGATSSGRPTELAGSASIIGCFMNTLPFRVFADAGYETIPWLQDIQRSSVEMRQFEYTPLSDIRSWSEVPRNSALYDLYESIVIIENYPFDTTLKDGLGSLKVQSMRVEEQMDYPLTVYCNLQPELHFNLLFDYRYLADDTAHRMLGHLINIIQGLLEGEGRTTGEISMLSGDELRQITDGSDAYMNVPKDQSFNELFEAQVKLRPGHTAVICGDERLTYGELDILSNRLAHKLIKWG
ncbi:AMP-binding protein, partial [Paenibacillus sepulcri]|nr:AMP-binding protein [Paenibacillus sepulcri]